MLPASNSTIQAHHLNLSVDFKFVPLVKCDSVIHTPRPSSHVIQMHDVNGVQVMQLNMSCTECKQTGERDVMRIIRAHLSQIFEFQQEMVQILDALL